MDAEIKTKWVKALRSGKYKQGSNYLRRGNDFCCLGVLCDIVEPDAWRPASESDHGVFCHNGGIQILSSEMRERVGGMLPIVTEPLMEMNDSGTPFPEIADYIEKSL
jgi:hypothetical protein